MDFTPKCLIKINTNQTLIDRILELLIEGISDIHIVVGYKSNLIKKIKKKIKYHYFKKFNIVIIYKLLSVKKLLNKETIILFSDIIFDEKY